MRISKNIYVYSFENKGKNAWPRCPKDIIKHWQPVSEIYLTRITVEKSKVQLTEDKDHILVEVVANEHADPSIPPSAMSHNKLLEELKFPNSIICTSDSL